MENKSQKKVLTYGTFDLLHEGHINLLQRAKKLGDYLIVGLSTESFNLLKHKETIMPYGQRKILLKAIKYVDEVIPEETWEQKIKDIQKHNVDIFVMGNDWEGKFDDLKSYCEVIYLQRTPKISSTQIKSLINKRLND